MEAKQTKSRGTYGVLPFALLLGGLIAWVGGANTISHEGIPILIWLAAWAFLINWMGFAFAYAFQTEKFYDLIGSVTFISSIVWGLVLVPEPSLPGYLLACAISIWSARLGFFLFGRIRRVCKDGRFDSIKPSFIRFLNAWTLQALWVLVCISPAIAAISSEEADASPTPLFWIGMFVWALGMALEVVADNQKSRFKRQAQNGDKYIDTGLWSIVRHPNYLGEIVLWAGLAIASSPYLSGWQLVTLVSPFLIAVLLTKISGVPLLEERAAQRWGHLESFRLYQERTPRILPSLFGRKKHL